MSFLRHIVDADGDRYLDVYSAGDFNLIRDDLDANYELLAEDPFAGKFNGHGHIAYNLLPAIDRIMWVCLVVRALGLSYILGKFD